LAPATRRELVALLVLGLVVLAATRHLVLEPGLALRDPHALRDLLALEQLQRLVTGQQAWGDAWLGWPAAPSVAQADWLLGQALLDLPVAALDLGTRYALLALLGMLATAWLAHRIATAWLGSGPHSWVAGAFAGLAPVLLGLGTPLGLVHSEAVLGGALLLGSGLSGRRPLRAGLGGALLAGSPHLGWQHGAHGVVLLLVLSVLAIRRSWGDGRSLGAASAGLLLGLVSLLPPALATLDYACGHQASWSPSLPGQRWWVLAVMAAGLALAAGMRWRGLARIPPAWQPLPAVLLLGCLLAALPSPGAGDRPTPGIPEVYLGLDAAPPGPLYERFTHMPERCACDPGPRLAAALLHGRPIVGGHWAWDDPGLVALEATARRFPEAQAAELLGILGVTMVIEHAPLSGAPPDGTSCQRVGDHRLCAIEPLFPQGLPREDEVQPLGHGPVVGVRLLELPSADRLELRCPGQRPWRTTTHAWEVVAKLRHGAEPPWFDLYLPQPCSTVPEISEGSPLPLYTVASPESP
jgi:hypothetical protein